MCLLLCVFNVYVHWIPWTFKCLSWTHHCSVLPCLDYPIRLCLVMMHWQLKSIFNKVSIKFLLLNNETVVLHFCFRIYFNRNLLLAQETPHKPINTEHWIMALLFAGRSLHFSTSCSPPNYPEGYDRSNNDDC